MKKKEFLVDIVKLTVPDLKEKARSLAEELMKLRFRRASSQLDQSHRFKELRRNLARVKGAITSRTAVAASNPAGK